MCPKSLTSGRSLTHHTGGSACVEMSTIHEVRAAEKRVRAVLDALKTVDAQDPDNLRDEVKNATDEYARAVRELSSK